MTLYEVWECIVFLLGLCLVFGLTLLVVYDLDKEEKLSERKCIKLGKANFLFKNYPYVTDPEFDNQRYSRRIISEWNKNHMAVLPFVLNIIAYALFLVKTIFTIIFLFSEMTKSQKINEAISLIVYSYTLYLYVLIVLIRTAFDKRKIKQNMKKGFEEYVSARFKNNTDNPPPEDKP